jgi:hypothetical protein
VLTTTVLALAVVDFLLMLFCLLVVSATSKVAAPASGIAGMPGNALRACSAAPVAANASAG